MTKPLIPDHMDAPALYLCQAISSVESQASGPSYSVPRLAQGLAKLGPRVDLVSVGKPGASVYGHFSDVRCRPLGRSSLSKRLGLSGDFRALLHRNGYSVIHTHGLWTMPNVYPASAARSRRIPLVLSPRGMLGEGALVYSRWRKRLFMATFQRTALRAVYCFHATSEMEYLDIRRNNLRQPVAIIPNGVDLPSTLAPGCGHGERFVLSLGRIHPKKGLDRLISAWAVLEKKFPLWRLRIVGQSEAGHGDDLRLLIRSLGLSSVTIEPPVFGAAKNALMQEAELFVLATRSENFALTVAESLANGTPVISTTGAPWAGLVDNGCGWWVDQDVSSLTRALYEAVSLSDSERREMGLAGREWMRRDFGWDPIAADMLHVYEWLLGKRSRPRTVVLT